MNDHLLAGAFATSAAVAGVVAQVVPATKDVSLPIVVALIAAGPSYLTLRRASQAVEARLDRLEDKADHTAAVAEAALTAVSGMTAALVSTRDPRGPYPSHDTNHMDPAGTPVRSATPPVGGADGEGPLR